MPDLRISPELIAALHQAVVRLRLNRDALLSGVDASFLAAIPIRQDIAAQVLTDLHELNRVRYRDSDVDPLWQWLLNAQTLAGNRAGASIFFECLKQVQVFDDATDDHSAYPSVVSLKCVSRHLGRAAQLLSIFNQTTDAAAMERVPSRTPPPSQRIFGSPEEIGRLQVLAERLWYLHWVQDPISDCIRRLSPLHPLGPFRLLGSPPKEMGTVLATAPEVLNLLGDIVANRDRFPAEMPELYRALSIAMCRRLDILQIASRIPPEDDVIELNAESKRRADAIEQLARRYDELERELGRLCGSFYEYVRARETGQ